MNTFLNQAQLLYEFFSDICPAYLQNTVPDGTEFPYLTYTLDNVDWETSNIIQVKIYTKEQGVKGVVTLADKLANKIGQGITIDKEGTYIYLRKGSPFLQFMVEDAKNYIKSVYSVIEYNVYSEQLKSNEL